MIHILVNKFEKNTVREWKETKFANDLPSLEQFINFLKNKTDILQSLDESQAFKSQFSTSNKYHNRSNNLVHFAVKNRYNFCRKEHSIYKCPTFKALSVEQRFQEVRKHKLCENCLLSGHDKSHCKFGPCPICKTHKHNTLLHKDYAQVSIRDTSHQVSLPTTSDHRNDNLEQQISINFAKNESQVLLATVLCNIKDQAGNYDKCRALLDCGAQMNLITERFCNKLKLQLTDTNCSITDFNSSISCLVVPVISSRLPAYPIDMNNIRLPHNINLADPEFNCPKEIDLLLGAHIFWDLILQDKISLGKNFPLLINTQLGWVVTGTVPINSDKYVCNFIKVHIPEDDQLKKFWELEDVPTKNEFLSQDDRICESVFKQDTFRDENGQFVVKLPLKHSPSLLGDSKQTAIKRFKSLESKFSNSYFKQLYFDFIHEYENLGHMKKISINSEYSYFLPHHGILKESSVTTKLRTVFDGSCQSSSGWSLNDLQYVGPKVQNDILNILLRFRIYKYVVSANISKMYRQILIHPDHKYLQQILWRKDNSEEFSIYQLNTVTYGTRSAPYLAIKCIRALAEDNLDKFPLASSTILNDMYVDDLLTGSNDLSELQERCKSIYHMLKSAQFVLRKWVSNDQQVITNFQESDVSNSVLNLGDHDSCKTLGVQWLNSSDSFTFNINKLRSHEPFTKRHMLSIIAQIYDPLGLLSPSIIIAKILIQQLWTLHISWDTPIPLDLQQTWLQFQNNIVIFNQISIPRKVVTNTLLDIHCFCDASKAAYATCIYLRSVDDSNQYHINLLCSKTKVAPIKLLTIPKLELCACLLGVQLIKIVTEAINVNVPIFMWSDSQVALSWIHTDPSKLQVFVANRVAKIQALSNMFTWNYVNSSSNPADIASRGIMPEKLISNTLWWNGPTFLQLPQPEWPNVGFKLKTSELTELKKTPKVFQVISVQSSDLITRYSNFIMLQRITAYCLRFIYNLRNKANKRTGNLSIVELDEAHIIIIKQVQLESFADELSFFDKGNQLPKSNRLSSLTPFMDNKGILLVGGRLNNTYLSFNTRHPILLSSKHYFTKLIFEYKHKQLFHPGPQLLLSAVRQRYWPIAGRVLAKQVVKNCLTCFKFNPTPFLSPMSNLPNNRIKPNFPFDVTGIDYAGPFNILNKKGRGAKVFKCYLALFICFCTKAVHLEVVSDLTKENFLSSLKRFTARRGIPSTIYSDNGSTFIGANNYRKSLGHFLQNNYSSIEQATSELRVKWIFIPPYTPNHGGLWEAAVKSTKHHLKRILINNNVTFEEFNTLIIQIEGILNSRPLFEMSSSPNDLSPITPSHFLIGRPLTSLPEYDVDNIASCRLSRFQHVQQLYQQFWHQFSKQYVSQLHQQYKWKDPSTKIRLGTLVLIKTDSVPPCKWSTGRITKLYPGRDGETRVAEVTTRNATVTRSIRHLCPLPMQDELIN
ncbi:uncharacterized protein [Diabrotica undecimpunctata]|uniref:uncharacterized protein n=1 Tax=Diabrotica undecimpunctata TaxID=50387 RepID=UPI003B63B927